MRGEPLETDGSSLWISASAVSSSARPGPRHTPCHHAPGCGDPVVKHPAQSGAEDPAAPPCTVPQPVVAFKKPSGEVLGSVLPGRDLGGQEVQSWRT